MANRTIRTLENTGKFLESLRKTANVSKSARAIGAGRRTVYEWREEDKEFAADWDEAIEEGLDALEEEVRRRALKGTLKPVFYQGKKCGSVREYSDTLAMFILKGGRPEKFRERHEITGGGGVPLIQPIADALVKVWGDGDSSNPTE